MIYRKLRSEEYDSKKRRYVLCRFKSSYWIRAKTKLPTHIEIRENTSGLKNNSVVLVEQIRTIDKSRLKEKIGHIDDNKIINELNNALGISFGLD